MTGDVYITRCNGAGIVGSSDRTERSSDRTERRQTDAHAEQQTVRAAFHLLFCCGFGVERSFIGICFGAAGFSSVKFGFWLMKCVGWWFGGRCSLTSGSRKALRLLKYVISKELKA